VVGSGPMTLRLLPERSLSLTFGPNERRDAGVPSR
jgi:hypothetical protein